jgi:hypothetical protein
MLTLMGPRQSRQHCDGLSRRDFVRIGGLGLGGLSLAQLLALENAQAADSTQTRSVSEGPKKRHKSLIMIFLCGGPPHQDMYDLKPDAPSEIRGEFQPMSVSCCRTSRESWTSWCRFARLSAAAMNMPAISASLAI